MITRRTLFKLLGAVGLAAAVPKIVEADDTFALPDMRERLVTHVPRAQLDILNRDAGFDVHYVIRSVPAYVSALGADGMRCFSNIRLGDINWMVLKNGQTNGGDLLCDGRRVRVADHPELFELIGHTYG